MLKHSKLVILAVVLTLLMTSSAMADTALDTIMNAGTTQAFASDPIPEADIEKILQAGLTATSAINQQPWYFVAVTNQEVMKEIAGSGMGAPQGKEAGKPAPDGKGMPPAPTGFGGAKASLGDSPLAIILYVNEGTSSPDAHFDCGLAAQNMYLAAVSPGYGVKIVSSPTRTLNGDQHDALCETLGVDTGMKAVAVLLIGKTDISVDAATGASVRDSLENKTNIIQ